MCARLDATESKARLNEAEQEHISLALPARLVDEALAREDERGRLLGGRAHGERDDGGDDRADVDDGKGLGHLVEDAHDEELRKRKKKERKGSERVLEGEEEVTTQRENAH